MENLLKQLVEIKKQESELKEKKELIEVEIYTAVKDQLKDESQSTMHFGEYKLVIKPNWVVKVDQEKASKNADLFKVKYEMSYSQYNKCEYKNIVDDIVEIKQNKPTFTVSI